MMLFHPRTAPLNCKAKAKINVFEAQAKEKKAEVEIAAINALKTTKQTIDKKFQDLKKAGEATVAR